MRITRRNALAGATAAVAVAAVPVTVQASTAVKQRYAEWQTARQVYHGAIYNQGEVETRTRDALIARGLEFGSKAYWGAWHESDVNAASDRESRTSGECDEAFARLNDLGREALQI